MEDHEDPLFSGNQRVISLIMKPITEVNVQDVYVVVNVKEDAISKVVTDDLLDRADNYFLISRSGEAVLPLSIQTSSFQRDPDFHEAAAGPRPRIFQI